MALGRIGIWQVHRHGTDAVPEIEGLGFGALWLGGSPSVEDARPFLERSSSLTIATGILNVWRHEPAEVATRHAQVRRDFPGRFLLGIGIGHPEATSEYTKPLATMRKFFDALDAAPEPVPRDERLAAALGPKMLELAAERAHGVHPYFVPVEHTAFARQRLGPGPVLAVEQTVVLEADPTEARRVARGFALDYLQTENYARNLKRVGWTDADVAGQGSDALIDAVIAWGDVDRVAVRIRQHLDAGADHVCVQVVSDDELDPCLPQLRELAPALLEL
jgi:probable F420-dependent oxidoreductase